MVYYYSHKESNRFLAQRIANDLNCEIEEVKPRLNAVIVVHSTTSMLINTHYG
jgi:hypothetical protein